jgi:hypothetical protein
MLMTTGAVLNGTLYYYGGLAITSPDQENNKWSTY